jgi:hypothetical protein
MTGYWLVAARTMLGLVLATAVLTKLRGREVFRAFRDAVGALGLLPGYAVTPAAGSALVIEASLCAAMWHPATRRFGLLATAVLLLGYAGLMRISIRSGRRGSCPCFGARQGRPIGYAHVVRNTLLAGTAAVAAVPAGSGLPVHPAPAGLVVAVLAGVLAALLIIWFDDLAELFTGPTGSPGSAGPGTARGTPAAGRR